MNTIRHLVSQEVLFISSFFPSFSSLSSYLLCMIIQIGSYDLPIIISTDNLQMYALKNLLKSNLCIDDDDLAYPGFVSNGYNSFTQGFPNLCCLVKTRFFQRNFRPKISNFRKKWLRNSIYVSFVMKRLILAWQLSQPFGLTLKGF